MDLAVQDQLAAPAALVQSKARVLLIQPVPLQRQAMGSGQINETGLQGQIQQQKQFNQKQYQQQS